MVKPVLNSQQGEQKRGPDVAIRPCTNRKLLLHKQPRKLQKRSSSFLKAVFDYLTSDSFMYGPLLSPPASAPATAATKSRAGVESPLPLQPESARKLRDSVHKTTPSVVASFPHANPAPNKGGPTSPNLHSPASISSGLILSSSQALTKRIIYGFSGSDQAQRSPLAAEEELKRFNDGLSTSPPVSHVNNGLSSVSREDDEGFTDHDDESRSVTDSLADDEFMPLSTKAAIEISQQLVKKVGGRYSKELGIFVDIRDSEVERWFLATTFLIHPSDFELSKHMFKKLQNLGILKIQDVLKVDQNELEELFQNTIHTKRMASRLQKIARALHEDHKGGICSLQGISDYTELRRELTNIPGYSRNAARVFLRELQGVWPGAMPNVEARATSAAKHLHLQVPGKDGSETPALFFKLAKEAGLDFRDLEVALIRFGLQHARQYRNCAGGIECEFLKAGSSNLDRLTVHL